MAKTLDSCLVGEIDISAPFESVREAATRFGGFGFWKPSSYNIPDASQISSLGELEKELIAKEEETLRVLKSLESTKATVEELKSKLNRNKEKENSDFNVLKDLHQAKTNLCKTTEDLALILKSVELLNKRLEEERATLEKTRERLNPENAAEISKEIQRLSHEAKEFSKTGENARSAVDKAVAEIVNTRNNIKTAEMRLVAARKMKEAARAAEAVAIAEIKDVTRRRRGKCEEILEKGLETVEGKWMRSSSSSCSEKYKNPFLVDVNGLNHDVSSVAILKPTMSIGQILSRKLLLAEESTMMNHKVSLGQILGKTYNDGERKEKEKIFNGKRKRFGLAKLSVMLNKESHKSINKKKKIALNLKG